MKEQEKLSASMEDYLETIDALKRKNGAARVKDIGKCLEVKNSSVNSALATLSKKGFVVHERYGYVELTAAGQEVAREVQNRHDVLIKFLTEVLCIDNKTATEDACKMEHSISYRAFNRLTKFIQFVETGSSETKPEWLKSFEHFFKTGKRLKCKMRRIAERKR